MKKNVEDVTAIDSRILRIVVDKVKEHSLLIKQDIERFSEVSEQQLRMDFRRGLRKKRYLANGIDEVDNLANLLFIMAIEDGIYFYQQVLNEQKKKKYKEHANGKD